MWQNLYSNCIRYFKLCQYCFKLRHPLQNVEVIQTAALRADERCWFFFLSFKFYFVLLVFSMVPNICYFCFLRTARCYFEVEKIWVKDFAINRIIYIDSNNDNELLIKSSICVIQPLNKCWYRFSFLAL